MRRHYSEVDLDMESMPNHPIITALDPFVDNDAPKEKYSDNPFIHRMTALDIVTMIVTIVFGCAIAISVLITTIIDGVKYGVLVDTYYHSFNNDGVNSFNYIHDKNDCMR